MQETAATLDQAPRVAVVGAGRLGTVLARALSAAGYPVVACASRSRASAERLALLVPGCEVADTPTDAAGGADWVFLTVPDDAIATVATEVDWRLHHVALHCSGARPAAIMEAAVKAGAWVAGFHPLQTLADAEGGLANLPGSAVGIEADDEIWPDLARMARALGMAPLRIGPEQRAIYHLGSVITSNFTVGLLGLAADLWSDLGIDRQTAVAALVPLLQGTARNLATLGVPAALTGPVARGDLGTVAAHLAGLNGRTTARDVYIALSSILVDLAAEDGRLGPEAEAALRRALQSQTGGDPSPSPEEGRTSSRRRAELGGRRPSDPDNVREAADLSHDESVVGSAAPGPGTRP